VCKCVCVCVCVCTGPVGGRVWPLHDIAITDIVCMACIELKDGR